MANLKVGRGKPRAGSVRFAVPFVLSVLSVLCFSSASAQEFLGTKSDPISSTATSAGGSGIGSLFNVLIALGIVYGLLRFAMPKVMSRLNKRLVTSTGSAIRIEESATFAGGSLFVVSARGKTLLLSVSSQGVQNLADLTEERAKPEPEVFSEIVDRAVVLQSAASESPEKSDKSDKPDSQNDWQVALERLERLAS